MLYTLDIARVSSPEESEGGVQRPSRLWKGWLPTRAV
nr:MAG TPA: hypothetical protein [Caudoviricetes sp.]